MKNPDPQILQKVQQWLICVKNKKFDCVEMKRRGAERVLDQIKNMSRQQQLEYWQKGTQELKSLQKKVKIQKP